MAHRWCNQDFGRNNGFTNKTTHCDKYNYYSYSTVIAQWLDHERKIMVVFDNICSTSNTTNSHRSDIYAGVTPETIVFPYTSPGSYTCYAGGELCSWAGHFDYSDRLRLLEYYLKNMFNAYAEINESKKLSSLQFTDYWKYADKLCELYKDTTLKKWLRNPSTKIKHDYKKKQLTQMRKMVQLHIDGITEISEIINGIFGDGAWEAYMKRTESLRKAAHSREYIAKVNAFCGYNPYTTYSKDLPYRSMADIKRDGAYGIMLRKLDKKWHNENDERVRNAKIKAIKNALSYLGISNLRKEDMPGYWTVSDYSLNISLIVENGNVVYKDRYNLGRYEVFGYGSFYIPSINFRYNDFASSVDPKKYKERFLKKAVILGRLKDGEDLYINIHLGKMSQDDLNDEQAHVYNEFCAYYEKEQARNRKRQQIVEDRRAKEAAEKAAKIEAYKVRGVDGMRDMWRDRLCNIYEYEDLPDFYEGGNVLLRWNKTHSFIETSKSIKLSIAQCKRYWKIISIWHEHPDKFKPVDMETNSGTYRVVSYKDDVLTAGCHKIAYAEMKRMMSEILGDAA